DKVSVKVGSAPHPMTEAHYISYIYLHTLKGVQYKYVSGEATADFCVTDDKPIAVYAYCNLHGLWKTQLN
ncbi:MAG: desulfoferrodoxin family protein, partial [Clostridia bacterium]